MALKKIYKKDGSLTRHRGQFNPEHPGPFELSRSKVESFIKCPACFWLDRAKGVKFPSIPSFNINSNTDKLLKRDFDSVRGRKTHSTLAKAGLGHLIPFDHEDLEKWTNSLHFGLTPRHFNTLHEETNILFGGGLDDVLQNQDSGVLHIVDFKSTSNQSNEPYRVNLEGQWKASYKRQMDMYIWLMRRKGFETSDIGYFVYVDGLHDGINGMLESKENAIDLPKDYAPMESLYDQNGVMYFGLAVLEYEANTAWVPEVLKEIKECLTTSSCPVHAEGCEYAQFLDQTFNATRLR